MSNTLPMGDLSVTVPPPPNKGHCLYAKGSSKIFPENPERKMMATLFLIIYKRLFKAKF